MTTVDKNKIIKPLMVVPSRSLRKAPSDFDEEKLYYAPDGTFNPPVTTVIQRFKRLRWGAYIHPRAGRAKHLYRKSDTTRSRLKEHILTYWPVSYLLDNMTNEHFRKPRYYPDDIYEPYHKRTGVPYDYGLKKRKFYP